MRAEWWEHGVGARGRLEQLFGDLRCTCTSPVEMQALHQQVQVDLRFCFSN